MPIPAYVRDIRAKIGHDLLMMPGVAAIIFNDEGEVLLQRRADNGLWGIPGGMIEPGEEPAETVIREVYEETGLRVIPERIAGVFGGPMNMGEFPNGDRFAVISITFCCRLVDGELRVDHDETLELSYFPTNALPSDMMERHRQRVLYAVTQSEPYFALPKASDEL